MLGCAGYTYTHLRLTVDRVRNEDEEHWAITLEPTVRRLSRPCSPVCDGDPILPHQLAADNWANQPVHVRACKGKRLLPPSLAAEVSERETHFVHTRPEGLEPPACWFEVRRSVQFGYGRSEHNLWHSGRLQPPYVVVYGILVDIHLWRISWSHSVPKQETRCQWLLAPSGC